MPDIELLATGEGDYRLHDPDTLRAWMRDRKRRDLVDKTTTAADAVGRLVADGDYVSRRPATSTGRRRRASAPAARPIPGPRAS